MELSGQQRKQLHNALVDAFPDKSSIEQMLSYQLDKNLDAIAGGDKLEEIVFNLIKTAKSQGWIEKLVRAAHKENPGNSKLKAIAERLQTLTASLKGLEKAKEALKTLGKSETEFAKSLLLNPSVVTEFFQSQPVQLNSFKRICEALELNWREVAEMLEEERAVSLVTNNPRISEIHEGMESVKLVGRQLTVIDKQSKIIKAVIVLEGTLDEIKNDLSVALELVLRTYSEDTIKITEIKEGSIKLFIEGSLEDIEKLMSRIQSGELKELNGFPVKDIQILSESSDDESSELDDKWRLVREIVSQPVKGRKLKGADLSDADLSNAILFLADLSGADLSGADLSGVNLSGVFLLKANLFRANLSSANLMSADLYGVDLSNANLSGADLSNANLSGADLSNANLSGADLSNANLSGADLSNANLSGVDLSNANLRGATIDEKTQIDNKWRLVWEIVNQGASGRDLSRTDLSRADLSNANLSGANLSGADLSNADLSNADLSNADLSNADLSDADLSGATIDETTQINSKWRLSREIVHQIGSSKNLREIILRETIESESLRINSTRTNLSRINPNRTNQKRAILINTILIMISVILIGVIVLVLRK